MWPGSSVHAQEALRNPRFEDFTYVQRLDTKENILAWIGNGLTISQHRGEDTTTYLDTVDIPPIVNQGPRPCQQQDNKTKAEVLTEAEHPYIGNMKPRNSLIIGEKEILVDPIVMPS